MPVATVQMLGKDPGGPVSVDMDDAIEEVGIGRTQWVLLILCGLTFCSDAAEVTFLSYVTEVLKCEWDLTAQQESLIGSAVFLGMILGAPVWGYIADHCGRRNAFLASSVVICLFGFLTACCRNHIQLVIARGIVGFGVSGLPVGFDILAEALPVEGRGKFLLYIEYFWTFGGIYVNFAAWVVLEQCGWQFFTVLAALPTLIASLVGYVALPESPRWLLDQGRHKEAVAIVNDWAEKNGKCTRRFDSFTVHKTEVHGGCDVCKKPRLRKSLFLMATVWFGFGIAYYGVVMLLPRIFESKGKVGECDVGFDFKHLAMASASEIVGVAIAICIIDRPGRAYCQGIFYTLGGVAALALGNRNLPKFVLTIVASVGRLAEMAASCATWVHTPELFPTRVRAEVHGVLNLTSKIGASVAPFLISEAYFTQMQSGSIMAFISFLAAAAALFLPETSGKELKEMSESEDSSESGSGSSDEE